MAHASHIGDTEFLQIADAVAREKNIKKDLIIASMERAIEVAARKKYGYEHNIRATINKKTGEIELYRDLEVVDDNATTEPVAVESPETDDTTTEEEKEVKAVISLTEARTKNPDAEIGDVISEPLPPIDLGRVAAQTAKQVIVQQVRDIERENQYEDFKDRVGEIVNGIVEKIEHGNVTIRVGSTEAIIPRRSLIRNESFRVHDRIRAYVEDVRREQKGPQIFLSRTHPQFLAKLFAQEVPEVYDNIITIQAVAREPGSRAKIAVSSSDSSIDPVGSCVGVRGARVQAVINELQGERIDIIPFSSDPATFVVNALAPAEITKVVIDEDNNRIEVVVAEDQLSLTIGRRGQNVRLASQLSGWAIDILTEETESKRRTEDFNTLSQLFITELDLEEVIGQLLAIEGFTSIEEVAYAPIEALLSIEGFDEDLAEALRERARDYLETKAKDIEQKWRDAKVDEALLDIPNMTHEILVILGENKITSWDDFASLARDEFKEIAPDVGLSDDQIDEMIMTARSHWFEEDNKEAAEASETVQEAEETKTTSTKKKKTTSTKAKKKDDSESN